MTSEAKGLIYVPVWCDSGEIKALVNDDGKLPVVIPAYPTEINVGNFPVTIQGRQYTYRNGTWSPQSTIFNYHSILVRRTDITVTSGPGVTISWSNVPAGECWVLTSVFVLTNRNGVVGNFMIVSGGVKYYIYGVPSTTANLGHIGVSLYSLCATGQHISSFFYGLSADDTLTAGFSGYIMKTEN